MSVFWVGVAIALLLFAWRGWRLGLVRSILGLAALALGALLGWFLGSGVAGILGAWLPWPPFYSQVGMAAGLAVGAYLVTAILSGLLLKKTKDHESSWIRGLFGLGGAVVGLVTGALLGTAGIWMINASHSDPSEDRAASLPTTSLDGTYRVLEKIMKVTANPRAMERFMEYPGVQNLVAHPKIVALTSDPDINEAALKKDYGALFSNPAVLKALTDPTLVRELQRVELEKALDYSLTTSSEKK